MKIVIVYQITYVFFTLLGNLIEERRVIRRISESPPGKKEFRKSKTLKEREEPVYHTKSADMLDSQRCRPRRSTSRKDSSPRYDSDRQHSSSRKSEEPGDDSKHSRSSSKTSSYNHYTNKSRRQHFEGKLTSMVIKNKLFSLIEIEIIDLTILFSIHERFYP